jgi:hypothetical protein
MYIQPTVNSQLPIMNLKMIVLVAHDHKTTAGHDGDASRMVKLSWLVHVTETSA